MERSAGHLDRVWPDAAPAGDLLVSQIDVGEVRSGRWREELGLVLGVDSDPSIRHWHISLNLSFVERGTNRPFALDARPPCHSRYQGLARPQPELRSRLTVSPTAQAQIPKSDLGDLTPSASGGRVRKSQMTDGQTYQGV